VKTSCHCGSIRIEAEPPAQVTVCNCSICSRYQALWGYYSPQQVRLEARPGAERVYTWGDKELEFVRCSNCGCVTHYRTLPGQPDPRIAVNFRMLVEGTVEGIPVRQFDGKNMN
jgi:hypothetical protein